MGNLINDIKHINNEKLNYINSLDELLSSSIKSIDDNLIGVSLNDENELSLSIQNKTNKHIVYFSENGIITLLNYLSKNFSDNNNKSEKLNKNTQKFTND